MSTQITNVGQTFNSSKPFIKARLFVLDSRNSKPLQGIPLKAVLSISKATGATSNFEIGILSSDHKGYISFVLPPPIDNITNDPTLDASLNEAFTELTISTVYSPGISLPIWDRIKDPRFKSAVPFLIDGSLVPADTFNDSLPSVQSPDSIDWQLSPESFGSSAYTMIGQGDCEELLLSNAAIHTYRFSQLVRNRDENGPQILSKISTEADCEIDSGFNNHRIISYNNKDTQNPWFSVSNSCYKLGALLEYELTWKPINHGLGEVLYSLPLAPCESRKIAIIDWSREDKALRTEDTSNTEKLVHNQRRDRIIDETVEGAISEWQRGGSIMGGASASGSLGVFSGTAAAAGGYATSSGDRNLSADTAQNIADNVAQASSAIRRFNSTVIVQATQSESQTLETRSVTNHNHCHALTVLYYEIVRHFLVTTTLLKPQNVIFIRYPLGTFNEKKIFDNRQILKEALLDQSLIGCFDALETVYCNTVNINRYNFNIPAGENILGDVSCIIETGENGLTHMEGVKVSMVTTWDEMLEFSVRDSPSPYPFLEDKWIGGLKNDPDWFLTKRSVDIFNLKPKWNVRWKDIKAIQIELSNFPRSSRSDDFPIIIWNLQHIKLYTKNDSNLWVIIDQDINKAFNAGDTLGNPLPVNEIFPKTPESTLSTSDMCCKQKLVDHINQNLTYYNRILWLNEDPGERAIRFDQFLYDERFRLIDIIENKIVGVTGDYVAFPLTITPKVDFALSISNNARYEQILSIPTRGAFAEAKLGHCNSCETRDVTKFWDWQESPCNYDPPEISNISPVSPARDTNLTPTMPAASLNVAAPNEEPDPAGIGAALKILGTPNIFRDMSAKEQVAGILNKLIDSSTQLKLQDLKNQDPHTTYSNTQGNIPYTDSRNNSQGYQPQPTINQPVNQPARIGPTPEAAIVDATTARVAAVEDAHNSGATTRATRDNQRARIADTAAGPEPTFLLSFTFKDKLERPMIGNYMVMIYKRDSMQIPPIIGRNANSALLDVNIPQEYRGIRLALGTISLNVFSDSDFLRVLTILSGDIPTTPERIFQGTRTTDIGATTAILEPIVDPNNIDSCTFVCTLETLTQEYQFSGSAELSAKIELAKEIQKVFKISFSPSATVGGEISGTIRVDYIVGTFEITQ